MPTSIGLAQRPHAGANHTPNDALRRDAGDLAGAVARALPRPHAAYFEADPGRRRAIALLAARAALGHNDAEALSSWSVRRLLAHYMPDAPDGFAEALKRAQGVWSMADYASLISLLTEGGEAAKTLRHLAEITPSAITVLEALPPALRRTKILTRLSPSAYHADLLSRTLRQTWGRNPEPERLRLLTARLERAPSPQAMFAWLVEEVGVGKITPPPIPGTDWLRPILDIRDIERTALKFRNCLRTRIPLMLRGQGAYFEVLGEEPAVVEVVVSKTRWLVGEIRGHANDPVSPALMSQILTHLRQYGAAAHGAPPQLAFERAEAAGW